jgi:hypothetical protein
MFTRSYTNIVTQIGLVVNDIAKSIAAYCEIPNLPRPKGFSPMNILRRTRLTSVNPPLPGRN